MVLLSSEKQLQVVGIDGGGVYTKNRGKRRWLSGPEPRHTAVGSEKPKTGLQTGKMAYDHET